MAAGGMGEVWSSLDVVLGRQVAVKVLHGDLIETPGFIDRFRREARNLAMLSHPAIATLFDYGEQNGSPYLVMELVAGETLARRMAQGQPMSTDEVVDVLGQIASGLAVAHEAGLVHRDIKPANLMITDRGHVKITDFGISRLVDAAALTAAGDVLGTPQYMSPEQIMGRSASPSSDVYSLGVVAYEMLTGHPPFVADSQVAVALSQLHDLPPPLPDTVSRPVADLVNRALAKDPGGRQADGAALVAELGLCEHETVSAPAEARRTPQVPLASTVAMPASAAARTSMMTSADVDTVVVEPGGQSSGALMGSMSRHRTKRRLSFAVAGVAMVVLAWVIVVAGPSDGDLLGAESSLTSPTGATADSVVALTVPTSSAAVPTTVAAIPITVATVIDASAYVGRDRRQVVEELRALGYTVTELRVETDRNTKRDTVVAVEPNGQVPIGAAIEVQIARPVKAQNDDDDD